MFNPRNAFKVAFAAGTLVLASLNVSSPIHAEEIDSIMEKGEISIAMSGAYPPFNFVNDENKVVGFDPAVGSKA